ncbi:MAG: cation diffusion facilitator family transporter [Acidobacteriota bacterium]|nr:cation diffusion facilitator family transporter [Acidobacteriota bacterium]
MTHHHDIEPGNLDRRLWASAALNLGITLVELIGGLMAGSLALLADAAHNMADVGALGLAIFARKVGRRAPTARHTYGLKRAEVLAALFNAAALIAISALIAREAVSRFLHPEPVHVSVMLIAAVVALVANVASVLLLRAHRTEDINVRSAFLHLAQDALASLAVVAAALLARTAIGHYVDPVAALLIGIVVLRSAISIVWESLHTLLEAAPEGVDVEQLAGDVARRFPGVRLHHVHAWEVGPGQRVITAHMKVGAATLLEAEAVANDVRSFLHEAWGITHATLEAEANGCGREEILGEWS